MGSAKVAVALLELLGRLRDSVVPVIGAGLAAGCGSPHSAELAEEFAKSAGVEFPGGIDLYKGYERSGTPPRHHMGSGLRRRSHARQKARSEGVEPPTTNGIFM